MQEVFEGELPNCFDCTLRVYCSDYNAVQAVKSKLNTAGTQVGGALPSAAFHENPVEASTSEDDKDGEPKKGNTSEDKQNRRAKNTRDAGEATGEEAQQKLDNKVRLELKYIHVHSPSINTAILLSESSWISKFV